ncbi:hypothetical protein BD410DRAFT_782629 [Rickenella mellea]|uniref:Nucleolus and neural progenitor protein-like N-terminal domain-containing protein n=1 Tax=Rickenella mellea TaxID=50990 RepID=A0A4Y7QJY6_9AGAM|nr:hypothetical protein BD410DRAFT_782629 [Rickenella mellea]
MPSRCGKQPPISPAPRSSVEKLLHAVFDTTIKELRACSRRLTNVYSSLGDELQLLDRLYYKNNNQHHSALFWRKTEETRRFGRRILEMDTSSLADDLRYSFFAEGAKNNPKVLKGSWSHVPHVKFVLYVLERSQACVELVKTTSKRLETTFGTLTTAMKSGSFIQMILLLTAITSRFGMLLNELQPALEELKNICSRQVRALDPKKLSVVLEHTAIITPEHHIPTSETTLKTNSTNPETELNNVEYFDEEDIRSSVARPSPDPASLHDPGSRIQRSNGLPATSSDTMTEYHDAELGDIPAVNDRSVDGAVPEFPDRLSDQPPAKRKIGSMTEVPKSKKKRIKDDIDDIFDRL